jgi:hypothetical protein
MKHTLATLLLIFLCVPGMAQTKGKPTPAPATGTKQLTGIPFSPSQPTTLQPWIDSALLSMPSSGQITWATSIVEPDNLRLTYTALWLTVSRDEVKVGWLIPTCATANLKRAPKLTAWVIGMQAYSSPQAKWLSALFKACEIQ